MKDLSILLIYNYMWISPSLQGGPNLIEPSQEDQEPMRWHRVSGTAQVQKKMLLFQYVKVIKKK